MHLPILTNIIHYTQPQMVNPNAGKSVRLSEWTHMDNTTDDLIDWLLTVEDNRLKEREEALQGLFHVFENDIMGGSASGNLWTHLMARLMMAHGADLDEITFILSNGLEIQFDEVLTTVNLNGARKVYPSQLNQEEAA